MYLDSFRDGMLHLTILEAPFVGLLLQEDMEEQLAQDDDYGVIFVNAPPETSF